MTSSRAAAAYSCSDTRASAGRTSPQRSCRSGSVRMISTALNVLLYCQEVCTDPSYAGQVVTFTFPHVGNVGVNPEDDESAEPVAAGMVVKWDPTEPANWRAAEGLSDWLAKRGRIAIGPAETTEM